MLKRIQRKRIKGWKMPANTIYVGRPSRWGNPYSWQVRGRAEAVKEFKNSLSRIEKMFIRQQLKGKNLSCWCAPNEPCHADVLLDIANS